MTLDNFLDSSIDPSNGAVIVSNDDFAALESNGLGSTDDSGTATNAANPVGSGGFSFGGFLGSAANALGGAGNLALGVGQNYLTAQAAAQRAAQITQLILVAGVVVAGIYLLTRKKG